MKCYKKKCLKISSVKKNGISNNPFSLKHCFHKDRKLFDCYPFSYSLKFIYYRFATLLRQLWKLSPDPRYSQTAEKQIIHTSENLGSEQKRMKDSTQVEGVTDHSKCHCSLTTYTFKILLISVFCSIRLPAWTEMMLQNPPQDTSLREKTSFP